MRERDLHDSADEVLRHIVRVLRCLVVSERDIVDVTRQVPRWTPKTGHYVELNIVAVMLSARLC